MTDSSFKAMNIPYYYAVGCRDGAYSFEIAYTSDTNIAVAMRNAFENTWKKYPNKRYYVKGFNANGTVLEPYNKPRDGQGFYISALPSFKPMNLGEKSLAYPLRIFNSPQISDAVAVFASHEIADKVGIRLMETNMACKTMNGLMVDPRFYFDYSCPAINGEALNRCFEEGQL